MKPILKLIFKSLFGGLSWVVQNIIEHWKVFVVVAVTGYLLLLNFKVRNLNAEVAKLSDTVFKQDSIIVTVRSKYMVDSVNLVLREISIQNTLAQVSDKNKELEQKIANKDQLIKDLADGVKCKNIFGRIVNCK
jgi:cell division protein FtsL